MTLPKVIVTRSLPRPWVGALAGHCDAVFGPADPPGDGALAPGVAAHLHDAVGILSLLTERIDAAVLDQAPNLRVVSNMAVGVDNIDVPACTARGIAVGNTPGVLTEATADLTWALLLAAARGVVTAAADARAGRWTTWSPDGWLGTDLAGATLGIVGLGKIGRAVATRARAFGMTVLATTRSPVPDAAALGIRVVPRGVLLATADIVSLHVPLTSHTYHLIDTAALTAMKPTTILINTARGPIVDPSALAHALRTKSIAAAAIDVTVPEPLPPSDPLFALPNLLITPHIGSATTGTRRRMAHLACQNLLAGIAGQPLPHPVNPSVQTR